MTDGDQRPLSDGLPELEQRARRGARGGNQLYTDFRYLEAARAVEDVDVVQTQRDVAGALAGLLAGRRIGFEAARSPTPVGHDRGRRRELVPTSGPRRGAAPRSRTRASSPSIRKAAAIVDAVYEALSQEAVVGRTEIEVAWWLERTMREHGAEGLAFEPIVAGGLNGSRPHADPGRVADRARERSSPSTWDASSTATGRTAHGRSRPESSRPSSTRRTPSSPRRSSTGWRRFGPVRSGPTSMPHLESRSPQPASATPMAMGSATASGSTSTRAPYLRPESTDTLDVGNVVTVEPGLYLPGRRRLQDRGSRRRDRGRLRDRVVVHEGDARRRLARARRRLDAEPRGQRVERLAESGGVAPRSEESPSCRAYGRRPARRDRRGGRRRAAAARSTRTRASPA